MTHSLQKKSGPTADANTIPAIGPHIRLAPGGQARGEANIFVPCNLCPDPSACAPHGCAWQAGEEASSVGNAYAYGVASCTVTYRLESRARLISTDRNVGHRQNCRSTNSAQSPSSFGRSKPLPCLPRSRAAKSEQQSDGCQVNSSRRRSSLPRSLSRSQSEIDRRVA